MKLKAFIILLCLLTIATSAIAKNTLDIGIAGVGARPLAMGRAFVAVADDPNAIYLNPAGLGEMDALGITSMSTQLINRVDYKMVGGVYPFAGGTVGVGYMGTSTPAGFRRDDKGVLIDPNPMSYTSNFLLLSYGRKMKAGGMKNAAFGGSLKVINNSFSGVDASGTGFDADLGFILHPNDKLSLGLNYKNLFPGESVTWDTNAKEEVPSIFKAGAAYKVRDNLLVALDLDFATDSTPMTLHAGAEFKPFSILALRAGLDQEVASQSSTSLEITYGVGLNIKNFHFDYAYKNNSLLEGANAHYISLSYFPEVKKPKKPEKEKSVFEKLKEEKKEEKPKTVTQMTDKERYDYLYKLAIGKIRPNNMGENK
jgi:hypothetical protein